jgi:hypothetical protein
VIIDFEHLFDGFRDDQSAYDSLIANEHDTISELESGCGGSTLDRFSCVFNLEQSSIWAKGRNTVVISSSAWLHNNSLIFLVVSTLYEDAGKSG